MKKSILSVLLLSALAVSSLNAKNLDSEYKIEINDKITIKTSRSYECVAAIAHLAGFPEFNAPNRSEDFVSGRYRDVGFVQADLTIQDEHTDSDGNTQTTTYFNGRWLVFEFPRRFVSRLAVVGKGCWQVVYARRMERFETESTEFNRRFKVYMQDGVEMFYLLDPKMIEIMQALSDKYGGKILFLFADKKLHIGINDNTDSFEPPRHQKGDLDEEEEVRRLADEFRTVFELADKLELHKNIFK